MQKRCHPACKLCLGLLLGLSFLLLSGCDKKKSADRKTRYRIESIGLEIPKLKGWMQDREIQQGNAAVGGTIFRLIRENAVSGSPRIDVIIEDSKNPSLDLESFLEQNLREMNKLAEEGKISITQVVKAPYHLGPRRAFKVRHEYSLGASGTVAITQIALFAILDGRGVTISAAGRTELFHPLAHNISEILADMSTSGSKSSIPFITPKPLDPASMTAPQEKAPAEKSLTEPIDLGKIGTK